MKIAKWLLSLLSLALLVACYDDKSTNADKPLSHITIEQGIDSVYNIHKFDTLVIKPVITQENTEKPLSYTWEIDLEPYSHDEVFEYVANDLGKFNCRLIVENEDGKAFFPFVLYVNSDYEYGITVLSCDDEGNSMLSFMQEPMTDDVVGHFTEYDCFTRNNPDVHFAAGAADVVQCGGRLIIACRGGGADNDEPAIYFLNDKTMEIENMFTVPEYDDFKPAILGVPAMSAVGTAYPILCENGKVYDLSVAEGVVSESRMLLSAYARNCIVASGSGYEILLWDKVNSGLAQIYNGYGPYYCSKTYNLKLENDGFEGNNYFAGSDFVTMAKIRMTTSQKIAAGNRQEFLVITRRIPNTRSEVMYTGFWEDETTPMYVAHTSQGAVLRCPVNETTPCVANKTYFTLLFADGNKVRSWNYASSVTGLPKAPVLLTVGSDKAVITGFEISDDHKVTYVAFYEPSKPGLNGSVWLFDTDTGEVLEKHENFCYRPVKMFYKTR